MSVQDLSNADHQERVARLVDVLDLSSPDLLDESLPFSLYRALREEAPVKQIHSLGGTGSNKEWFVTRYQDIVKIFQDDKNFSSERNTAGGVVGPVPTEEVSLDDIDPLVVACHSQKIPLSLDPPEFSVYRPLLNPLFSPSQAREAEGDSREIARQLLDKVAGNIEVDFHKQLAKPLPAIVICRLLGLPEEEWQRFAITTPDAAAYSGGQEATPEKIIARVIPSIDAQMTMLRLAEQRRREPRDDLITAVAHLTVGGRLLNYYELGAILSVLLSGGVHTTTLAIEAALAYLGRNPDVQKDLRARPDLVKPFTAEVLRMWPPLHTFFRSVKHPVVIGDQAVEPGDSIVMCLASANRDPAEFPDPDILRIERHPNRHVTFAVGIHRCLGSSLARQELVVAVEEVLDQLPDFVLDEERVKIPPMIFGLPDPERSLVARFVN